MWPWRVKMPTQNLLMMRIVLVIVCCRFGSWGLVIRLNFCSDFQHKVCSGVVHLAMFYLSPSLFEFFSKQRWIWHLCGRVWPLPLKLLNFSPLETFLWWSWNFSKFENSHFGEILSQIWRNTFTILWTTSSSASRRANLHSFHWNHINTCLRGQQGFV